MMSGNCTSKKELLQSIDQVSFAIDDLLLFLDTHPGEKRALEYFSELSARRNELLEKYADLWDWNEIIRIWRNSIYEDKGIDFYDKFQEYIPASKLQNSALWNEMVEQQMNSLIRDIIS